MAKVRVTGFAIQLLPSDIQLQTYMRRQKIEWNARCPRIMSISGVPFGRSHRGLMQIGHSNSMRKASGSLDGSVKHKR